MLSINYFDRFLAEKRQGFCGRAWLFDEVDDWARQGKQRALLIKGDPGTGKSAVSAEMSHRRCFPHFEVLAWHCCQHDDAATLEPAAFIQRLAAQIAANGGNDYAACLNTPPALEARSEANARERPLHALKAGIFQALRPLPNPCDPATKEPVRQLLLIDALDEALTPNARGGPNVVALLSSTLPEMPPWLRLVATTRREPDVLENLRGFHAFELDAQDAERHREDIDDDLRKYVDKRLQEPNFLEALQISGRPRAEVLRLLLEKADRNFLVMVRIFDGIQEGIYHFAELEKVPPGLDGIYHDFLQRYFPDHDPNARKSPYRATWEVLEVVAAARQPLTARQLAAVTGQECEYDQLDSLRRLGSYVPERHRRFTFYHKSFGDWLTDRHRNKRFYVSEREGHKRLAAALTNAYQPADSHLRDYALAHLPYHLIQTERWDDLVTLLSTPTFPEAKAEQAAQNEHASEHVFALATDYEAAARALPPAHSRKRILELLAENIRVDVHFIARHPTTLFQCLWHRGWWYDCDEAKWHYDLSKSPPGNALPWDAPEAARLATTIEAWGRAKQNRGPFHMLRSLRPPATPLGSPLRQVLEGHSDGVLAVAWSPDGRTLASASDDGTVRLWDAATGAVVRTLEGHSAGVSAVAWSPDGRTLASASGDRTVRLWDAATGAVVRTLEGHSAGVRAVAWSPDGRTLASASDDGTVRLWDAATGVVVRTLEGHTDGVSAVAWSPDGRTLASASDDGTVRLWDAATGVVVRTLEGHTDGVSAVAWSPDGRTLASASDDGTVRLWDAATGVVVRTLEGHTDGVSAVAWSPDGRTLASASGDRTVRLWDAATGAVVRTLEGHTNWVSAVAWSPDGRTLASASGDRTVRLWDAATGAVVRTLEGHSAGVRAVAWSPDGRTLASASDDGTVRLWDAATGVVVRTLEGHTNWVSAVAWSPDGRTLASASGDRTVRLWDAATGAVVRTLEGHTNWVSAVAWSPDGRTLASASGDRTVRLWDAATGAVVRTLEGHTNWVSAVAWSPDGRTLASASGDRTVRLWDAATGAVVRTLEGHSAGVRAVAWSPDGRTLASASEDRTVRLWDAATGAVVRTLEGHTAGVRAVAWSPDGRTLASASEDRTVRLWDAATGVVVREQQGVIADVLALAGGAKRFPWVLQAEGQDRVVVTAADDQAIAWSPGTDHVQTHPSGRAWAGSVDKYVALFALEPEWTEWQQARARGDRRPAG